LWPTPNAVETGKTPEQWRKQRAIQKAKNPKLGDLHLGLSTAVKMWPTPYANEWKHTGTKEAAKAYIERGSQVHVGTLVQAEHGGQLNPTWVEWLMGFPLGWTDLNA
jgi:hypothetical protein